MLSLHEFGHWRVPAVLMTALLVVLLRAFFFLLALLTLASASAVERAWVLVERVWSVEALRRDH